GRDRRRIAAVLAACLWLLSAATESSAAEGDTVAAPADRRRVPHTPHPAAQWFPEAAFGLFLHWGIASVRALNISWPMVPVRPRAERRMERAEGRERIVRERDYNLNGSPPVITPLEYWAMARDFNPQRYDPDLWLAAAQKAGFKYAVLTT